MPVGGGLVRVVADHVLQQLEGEDLRGLMDEGAGALDALRTVIDGKAEEGVAVPVGILGDDAAAEELADGPPGLRTDLRSTLEIVHGSLLAGPLISQVVGRHVLVQGRFPVRGMIPFAGQDAGKTVVDFDRLNVPQYGYLAPHILVRYAVTVLLLTHDDVVVGTDLDRLPVPERERRIRDAVHLAVLLLKEDLVPAAAALGQGTVVQFGHEFGNAPVQGVETVIHFVPHSGVDILVHDADKPFHGSLVLRLLHSGHVRDDVVVGRPFIRGFREGTLVFGLPANPLRHVVAPGDRGSAPPGLEALSKAAEEPFLRRAGKRHGKRFVAVRKDAAEDIDRDPLSASLVAVVQLVPGKVDQHLMAGKVGVRVRVLLALPVLVQILLELGVLVTVWTFPPVLFPKQVLGHVGALELGQEVVQAFVQFRLSRVRDRNRRWRLEQGVELLVRHLAQNIQRDLALLRALLVAVDGALAHVQLGADLVHRPAGVQQLKHSLEFEHCNFVVCHNIVSS